MLSIVVHHFNVFCIWNIKFFLCKENQEPLSRLKAVHYFNNKLLFFPKQFITCLVVGYLLGVLVFNKILLKMKRKAILVLYTISNFNANCQISLSRSPLILLMCHIFILRKYDIYLLYWIGSHFCSRIRNKRYKTLMCLKYRCKVFNWHRYFPAAIDFIISFHQKLEKNT